METIICDRLLINDTEINTDETVRSIGEDAEKYNISIIDGNILGSRVYEEMLENSERVDRILLPGRSSSILLRCTNILVPEEKKVLLPSIRRKLDGLTPRGITIDDDDSKKLGMISRKEKLLILDDVVASGTTLNGIAKRLGRTDFATITLVSREPNELKPSLREGLISGCQVQPKTLKRPAINTLSSLRDPEKSEALLMNFRKLYGEAFTERINQLFSLT